MAGSGIPADPALVRHADFGKREEEEGYRCMQELLRLAVRPTAVFAGNDLMAFGAMAAVRDAQLRIPQDIAIVGFDDIPAARMVHPPLTTIAQFQDALGSKAAAMLLQRLTGTLSPAGRSVEMPYQLVIRDSV